MPIRPRPGNGSGAFMLRRKRLRRDRRRGGRTRLCASAAPWITGTCDPELNLVYWGTGNPGPDRNGDVRPGDNLSTCSMVALDADTGQAENGASTSRRTTHTTGALSPIRCWSTSPSGGARSGRDLGQPQRILLCARRNQGQVPAGATVHRDQLGKGHRSRRVPHRRPESGSH
jgi:hypothetical protein